MDSGPTVEDWLLFEAPLILSAARLREQKRLGVTICGIKAVADPGGEVWDNCPPNVCGAPLNGAPLP